MQIATGHGVAKSTRNENPYPIVQDFLHGFRVVEYDEAEVGQLPPAVDPQLQHRAVLCVREKSLRSLHILKEMPFYNTRIGVNPLIRNMGQK